MILFMAHTKHEFEKVAQKQKPTQYRIRDRTKENVLSHILVLQKGQLHREKNVICVIFLI